MRRNRQHRDGEEEKSVFEKIAAMIADQLGIDASTIQPESRLIEDLKADSLDVVAMVMEMETEFGIEIPDEDLTKLKTVADAMRYIEENQK
ncbi:MAG TPA: acyl carrier protein [Candidatus Spyradocola merdavium]|nr:acyl carrier protein [Candidatus Spyradocola merdavium]